MKILIVDDSADMRKLLRALFLDDSPEIMECSDGVDALDSYTRFHPDWVLMDIQMHQMDGITATKQICSYEPQAKVIIVTNYHDKQSARAAKNAGAIGFFQKEQLLEIQNMIYPKSHR